MTTTSKSLLAAAATLALVWPVASASAGQTEIEQAIAKGGRHMTAAEITERLADKTVTFVNATSGAEVRVYYDGHNGFLLRAAGKDETLEGFYATDLADHICVGVRTAAPMRLRCVDVVLIDGIMHKFELDGSLRGRVVVEDPGNLM